MTTAGHIIMRGKLRHHALLCLLLLAGCSTVPKHGLVAETGPLAVRWMRFETGPVRIELVNRGKDPIMVRIPPFGLFPFDLIYRANGERKGICEGDVFDGSPDKFVVLNPESSYSATYEAGALEGTEDVGDDIEELRMRLQWISVADASRVLVSVDGELNIQLIVATHAELGTGLTDIPIGESGRRGLTQ